MNFNQYTTKSQEAIQKAQQVAMEFGNQSIEPQHLLEGIFQVDENISEFLFFQLLKKTKSILNESEVFSLQMGKVIPPQMYFQHA